jgi:hypothetical protein
MLIVGAVLVAGTGCGGFLVGRHLWQFRWFEHEGIGSLYDAYDMVLNVLQNGSEKDNGL